MEIRVNDEVRDKKGVSHKFNPAHWDQSLRLPVSYSGVYDLDAGDQVSLYLDFVSDTIVEDSLKVGDRTFTALYLGKTQ